MKIELVKARSEKHSRLSAKQLLTTRNLLRTFHIRSDEDEDVNSNLSNDYFPSRESGASSPQVLAANPSETVSTKPKHTLHSSSATNSPSANLHPYTSTITVSPTISPKSANPKSHVSGVALGVAFGLIGLALVVIVIVWSVRRRLSREEKPDPSWKRYPFSNEGSLGSDSTILPKNKRKSDGYLYLDDEKALPPPTPVIEKVPMITDVRSSFLTQSMVITPPGNTLNNPTTPISANNLSLNSTNKHCELAQVSRSFLPTLPDELQIHQGEIIEVVASFDDGWALCLNRHGEKGVVPLECLTRSGGKHELNPQDGDRSQWRLSKRASSLYAGVSPGSY